VTSLGQPPERRSLRLLPFGLLLLLAAHDPRLRAAGLDSAPLVLVGPEGARAHNRPPASTGPQAGWTPLFNRRDLDGWTPKFAGRPLGENYKQTFRVENGLLKVRYDRYARFTGEFGHLFFKTPFSRYRVRVEYRFTGRQVEGAPAWALLNSGVMLHSQAPDSMGRDQSFPVSIEAQILGDDGTGKRTTGNVCTPGTLVAVSGRLVRDHCIVLSPKAVPPGRWTTMEIEVRGGESIRHFVDGQVVASYEQPQLDPDDTDGAAQKLVRGGDPLLRGGYIALQAESHPIEFRKVELRLLAEGE
jgi:hypothetical protein